MALDILSYALLCSALQAGQGSRTPWACSRSSRASACLAAGAAFVHATPSLQLANALATFVFSLLNVFCVSCCLRSYIRCRVLVTGGLHPLAGLRLRPELWPEDPVA